ncbi:uncharacterized protein LOC101210029 [Cucumis sativus]|uniref:DUF1677 family protein n=1 Tax=Cucumis sativus TaxID=3659 RepID=A0A0A0M274_CUCSA|nr:uncharacterized protein LOC101210029 [Cucumis sativus]KGN66311.1 hypothetical protein Csa_007438 [Cucumis sativus]
MLLAMDLPNSDSQTVAITAEVECVKCYSCGFTEDCTPAYISRVRDRFHGRWICGLCIEAVKDEVVRSGKLISTKEALIRHASFCKEFRSTNPMDETEHPISAMGRLLRRSLDSPRVLRSNSSNEIRLEPIVDIGDSARLQRSGSCFPSLSS